MQSNYRFGRAFKWVISLAAIGLLAACANSSLEKLRHAPPKGTAFQHELAKLYLAYAEIEQRYSNFDSSGKFAEKGLDAAYGNDLLPENPEELGMEGKALKQFARKRASILELLGDEVKIENPLAAAGSVFFYDCMLDKQISEPGDEEFNYCQEQWKAAMGDLREAQGRVVNVQSLENKTPLAKPQERYLVYFAFDDYRLNDSAERTVKLLYDALNEKTGAGNTKTMAIAVNGHTDTAGSDRYNMMLSNQRAETVKRMLVSLGMSSNEIATYGFGETDLAKSTGDGVAERQNRRVEVIVN